MMGVTVRRFRLSMAKHIKNWWVRMGSQIADQLKKVIESQHGGKATFRNAWQLPKMTKKAGEWDGIVHEFDLKNHPKASRVYAWSSPIKGGNKLRYFAVLHMGRVNGPVEAVKAAASLIRGGGRKKA